MIEKNNKISVSPRKDLAVQDFPINEIKTDPQKRIRQEKRDYKNNPKYIALKRSMAKFGLRNPISINTNCMLVEGFWRLNAAIDLGWEDIPTIIDYLTKKDAKLLEFQENFLRRDFSSYEIYTGIADLKQDHKEDYPESKRGKYNRSSSKNHDHKSIIPSGGNMIDNFPSFVEAYSPILGLKKTALYEKARIGEAILSEKFSSKTIEAILEEKITQSQLLHKLRQIDNKKGVRSKLKSHSKPQSPSTTNNNKKTLENTISNSERVVRTQLNGKTKDNSHTPDTIDTIRKMEELVELAREDKEIKKFLEEVKKGNLSIDDAHKKARRIIKIKMDITNESVDAFNRQGSNIKSIVSDIHQNYKDNKCRSCSLAHLFIVECYTCDKILKCEDCGIPAFIVLCEKDIKKGVFKFRNPSLGLCKNSPEYIQIVKNQIVSS